MDASHRVVMMIGLAGLGLVGQVSEAFKYSGEYAAQPSKQKLPVILMHKQALSENGAFNFAFAGDNGIKQGETINPDGTRAGAYSYVDPNGETISVKYTAGKDGFKIVQGDHVPRAPVVPAGLYGAASASSAKYSPSYGGGGGGRSASDEFEDDFPFGGAVGSYSHHRAKVNPALYRVHEESSAEHFPSQFVPVTYGRPAQARSQDVSDEHDGPHSFGSGYSFEFGNAAAN